MLTVHSTLVYHQILNNLASRKSIAKMSLMFLIISLVTILYPQEMTLMEIINEPRLITLYSICPLGMCICGAIWLINFAKSIKLEKHYYRGGAFRYLK